MSPLLMHEILINCCRANIEHFRWGMIYGDCHDNYKGKVIFWKGQLGSQLKPNWKSIEQNLLYRFLHALFI